MNTDQLPDDIGRVAKILEDAVEANDIPRPRPGYFRGQQPECRLEMLDSQQLGSIMRRWKLGYPAALVGLFQGGAPVIGPFRWQLDRVQLERQVGQCNLGTAHNSSEWFSYDRRPRLPHELLCECDLKGDTRRTTGCQGQVQF